MPDLGQPFDLAVFEDRLWVSDWEQQLIRTVHKRTGKNLQWTHSSFLLPASVVVLHDLAKPGTAERQGPADDMLQCMMGNAEHPVGLRVLVVNICVKSVRSRRLSSPERRLRSGV